MAEEILSVPVNDHISFSFKGISEIREDDECDGYRVALTADYESMAVPIKLDITTGDMITPAEIKYEYKLMFEERFISVLAYNLPTILAEKLETVISRGDQNTRPRDCYDVYILTRLQASNIDTGVLKEALNSTAEKRGTSDLISHYREIMQIVRNSEIMIGRWNDYRKDFDYAAGIGFDETCDSIVAIMDRIQEAE